MQEKLARCRRHVRDTGSGMDRRDASLLDGEEQVKKQLQ
jgi:hypothetical protein